MIVAFTQGTVELMETISGAKEIVERTLIVERIAAKLGELGPLCLVVPGRAAENGHQQSSAS